MNCAIASSRFLTRRSLPCRSAASSQCFMTTRSQITQVTWNALIHGTKVNLMKKSQTKLWRVLMIPTHLCLKPILKREKESQKTLSWSLVSIAARSSFTTSSVMMFQFHDMRSPGIKFWWSEKLSTRKCIWSTMTLTCYQWWNWPIMAQSICTKSICSAHSSSSLLKERTSSWRSSLETSSFSKLKVKKRSKNNVGYTKVPLSTTKSLRTCSWELLASIKFRVGSSKWLDTTFLRTMTTKTSWQRSASVQVTVSWLRQIKRAWSRFGTIRSLLFVKSNSQTQSSRSSLLTTEAIWWSAMAKFSHLSTLNNTFTVQMRSTSTILKKFKCCPRMSVMIKCMRSLSGIQAFNLSKNRTRHVQRCLTTPTNLLPMKQTVTRSWSKMTFEETCCRIHNKTRLST